MKNFTKILQVASVLLGFAWFTPSALAADVPATFPVALPHALPWNDGTTTYTKYWLYAPSFGTSGLWRLYYHNNGSGDISLGSDYHLHATTYEYHTFVAGNNAQSTHWNDQGTGTNFLGDTTGQYFDTFFGGVNTCKPLAFASHTVFAAGSYSGAAYCTDIVPYSPGDVIFDRVNLESDNQTFQRTTTDPAPGGIVNPDTSEYVDVPSPVTDPAGFVSALLTNLGIWLYNLVIPDSQFLADSYANIRTAFETKFAFYFQIKDAFTVPAASAMTPISLGSLHIGGQTLAPMTFIASFDPAEFASFRAFLSMVLYVGLGFFILRKLSNIFSS